MTDMDWGFEDDFGGIQATQTSRAPRSGMHSISFGSPAGKLIVTVMLYALWAGILTLMSNLNNDIFTGAICIIVVFAGWKGVTSIQPRMFLFMPIIGWIFYFGVKLVISVFAGLILAPWYLAKWIFLHI